MQGRDCPLSLFDMSRWGMNDSGSHSTCWMVVHIGDMSKVLMAIGGIIGTRADKVHTPMASPSLAVPTGRRDVKPVEIRPP